MPESKATHQVMDILEKQGYQVCTQAQYMKRLKTLLAGDKPVSERVTKDKDGE